MSAGECRVTVSLSSGLLYPVTSPVMSPWSGLLTVLILISVSSGGVYVRRGSDITDCSMKCPHTDGVLVLYKICGDEEEKHLLELWCNDMWLSNKDETRLHLNTSTGCWTLTDAGKDDSCVYHVVYDNGGRSLTTLHVTVLDPVFISDITSNSSRLGQDIAVSVQFSGEETTVTWEVDGGSLPAQYRLIDDNRTLIIPSAQREDVERRLLVRITNPVSEETREYQLKITVPGSFDQIFLSAMVPVVAVKLVFLLYVQWWKSRITINVEDKGHTENGS
ncbi:uncharacterized protein LOC142741678 [Rhinoderma darwinii]|uniref:uncharacterized protein LOC142741678 n=1 Tax=Rhinoderma darwinii TaxID=43563 RepID=UPI003F66EEC9